VLQACNTSSFSRRGREMAPISLLSSMAIESTRAGLRVRRRARPDGRW
jgi:hypothetical protein